MPPVWTVVGVELNERSGEGCSRTDPTRREFKWRMTSAAAAAAAAVIVSLTPALNCDDRRTDCGNHAKLGLARGEGGKQYDFDSITLCPFSK